MNTHACTASTIDSPAPAVTPSSRPATATLIANPPRDAIALAKVVAAQFIVWHHFMLYGPMAAGVDVLWPQLAQWLRDYGRYAVQVFLVVGGYLAFGSIVRAQQAVQQRSLAARWRAWLAFVGARWWRLVLPLALALLASVLAASLARHVWPDADVPAPATAWQFLVHLLLLQDLLDVPALSTGVWYVAIDLQLMALGSALWWLLAAHDRASGWRQVWPWLLLVLTAASLWLFNRNDAWDTTALYFVGSWALGVAVAWVRTQRERHPRSRWPRRSFVLALAVIIAVALWLDWRDRVAIAALGAGLLLLAPAHWSVHGRAGKTLHALADGSYGQFLLHYPVVLALGALAAAAGVRAPLACLTVLLLAWLSSMAAGWCMHRVLTRRSLSRSGARACAG